MFWTAVWLIVNILFVASVIFYLFQQRAYSEALRMGEDARRIEGLNRRRKLIAAGSTLLFLAMSASFLMNMAQNG
ncbi:hypothetical protein [Paenibacillus sp. HB172176]|uniref:hypothetical protein n=1 Tax=Paenibacillus sp. HB172176 TaxID=2493690 RepID=UPI00143C3403|nr:hypothetical protein [Paenibacillus sp. HB172176]